MIQRYRPDSDEQERSFEMIPDEGGDYVAYEDYEELEAEVAELTGDLPPMQLTDDDRKMLTEYLGECWHEIGDLVQHSTNMLSARIGGMCSKCLASDITGDINQRTFTTPADLHAVYSKMVERKEWEEFQNHMVYKYREVEKDDYTRWFVAAFEKWLFCLACPEQLPERMKLAAGWIRAKG